MFVENYLPQCLAMDMPEEKFWDMNPRKLKPYKKAQALKREKTNVEFHLMGAYVFDAVSLSIANALRGKNDPPIPYPSKPYDLSPKNESDIAKQKQQQAEVIKAQFMAFATNNNKRLAEEK